LAHQRPRQLRRLVERLSGSQTRCYIHVDRRAPKAVSGAVQNLAGVQLVEALACRWGTFSLVQAILRCLYAALDDETFRCDVAVLLSGAPPGRSSDPASSAIRSSTACGTGSPAA